MKIDQQVTQEAFSVIQQLAALCATPGISEDNLKSANNTISLILGKVVKPAVDNMTASASGLIVK